MSNSTNSQSLPYQMIKLKRQIVGLWCAIGILGIVACMQFWARPEWPTGDVDALQSQLAALSQAMDELNGTSPSGEAETSLLLIPEEFSRLRNTEAALNAGLADLTSRVESAADQQILRVRQLDIVNRQGDVVGTFRSEPSGSGYMAIRNTNGGNAVVIDTLQGGAGRFGLYGSEESRLIELGESEGAAFAGFFNDRGEQVLLAERDKRRGYYSLHLHSAGDVRTSLLAQPQSGRAQFYGRANERASELTSTQLFIRSESGKEMVRIDGFNEDGGTLILRGDSSEILYDH